jgi:phosphohistidine phosphatase
MDLILWRNAEAEVGPPDLERRLTAKGHRHAVNVAAWLDRRLPARYTLLVSPATRAQQTAMTLGIPVRAEPELAPGASAQQILELAGWPDHKGTVVLVGHQPDLGAVIGRLLAEGAGHWSIKKGGLWWLTNRVRNDEPQVVIRTVVAPDLV